MRKIIIYILIMAFSTLIFTGCTLKKEERKTNRKDVDSVKIIINNKEYTINLEKNETTTSFIKLLPLELTMNELNGNEKYVYLENALPTVSNNPKHINVGDVMLYGNNCLVIFYKSFDTSYSYTRIGHIDNLEELGKDNIKVKIDYKAD